MSVPADRHEWLSFEDPGEDRTWMFDVTFLMSSWTCIYGRGCQGVLTGPAAEYEQGCCSYGAHFIDDADVKSTEAFAARLTKKQWQFKSKSAKGIVNVDKDGTRTTKLVDDACIFLNRPGFEGGAGCALHQAAVASGERPLDWKPDVCWQLPLRLTDHVDEHGHVTSTLREWKRRDWGDGGAEFHWWCTEAPDAFVGHRPVYLELRDEIIEMTSEVAYDLLTKELMARRPKTLLPHPAVRR
jgi:hypothetical protein